MGAAPLAGRLRGQRADGEPGGSWTHLALTYDGSRCGLYVNGALAASQPVSGAIQSSSNPLWIGGNSPYGEYFNGLIDDVRVYNRALTAGRDPDRHGNTARRAAGSRYDAAVCADESGCDARSSATQVNLSWTAATDDVGVTGYRVERCQGVGMLELRRGRDPDGHAVQRHRV